MSPSLGTVSGEARESSRSGAMYERGSDDDCSHTDPWRHTYDEP